MSETPKYSYTDELQGKVWKNENKSSASDPDFKGTLCATEDAAKVTTGSGRDKKIAWDQIPGEKKLACSAWNNDGTLNVKIAKREVVSGGDDDLPF